MPFTFGTIALPVSILMMLLRTKGPVASFVKAGAVSEETARRPASVGIKTEYLIDPHIRARTLLPTGDGRYYANMPKLRTRARLVYGAAIVFAVIGLAAAGRWFFGG